MEVDLTFDVPISKNGLQLRTKMQVQAGAADVQGFDAHSVTREHQPLPGMTPNRNCKHAAQTSKAFNIPLEKSPQHKLGIAIRAEMIPGLLQLLSKLAMVVDLAVENDNGVAVRAFKGLVPRYEVDDSQPNCAKRNVLGFVGSLLIGAPVN